MRTKILFVRWNRNRDRNYEKVAKRPREQITPTRISYDVGPKAPIVIRETQSGTTKRWHFYPSYLGKMYGTKF